MPYIIADVERCCAKYDEALAEILLTTFNTTLKYAFTQKCFI